MGRIAGVPPLPDEWKECYGCGVSFNHHGLVRRLSQTAWNRRKFCSAGCRREHELANGRASGKFAKRVARHTNGLSLADHQAFWTERFSHAEICELAAAIAPLFSAGERMAA